MRLLEVDYSFWYSYGHSRHAQHFRFFRHGSTLVTITLQERLDIGPVLRRVYQLRQPRVFFEALAAVLR